MTRKERLQYLSELTVDKVLVSIEFCVIRGQMTRDEADQMYRRMSFAFPILKQKEFIRQFSHNGEV